MLNKKSEQELKNLLYFIFGIQRIFLLIPLLILCLSFSAPAQAKGTWDSNLQMWLDTTRIADLKNMYPGDYNVIIAKINDPDVQRVPSYNVLVTSSDPSVVDIFGVDNMDFGSYDPDMDVGIQLSAKKVGTATITIKYKTITKVIHVTVKKSIASFSDKTGTMTTGQKYSIRHFITFRGNKPEIKKIKSSNKKIIKVSGEKLIPKKAGKATITATINGKKQKIKITVKKAKPKPKFSQLKSKKAGLDYGNLHGESTVKIKLTNKTQYPITKVKLSSTLFFDDVLDDCRPKKTKTLTVNLKPGKSKTVKIYFGKYPVSKPTRWTYKILQFWYKQ